MPAIVHISKHQWKLLVIYTLQKEKLQDSGIFTAFGLTFIVSNHWQLIHASTTLVNIQG
jgi:hypothetical protein